MATRAFVIDQVTEFGADCWIVTWTGLLNGDDGDPIKMPECADGSVQFFGTFGVGGTIQWEGTNQRTTANFIILTDPQGTTITKTAAAIETCEESCFQRRPRVTAGDGTTSLTCVALLRRGYAA